MGTQTTRAKVEATSDDGLWAGTRNLLPTAIGPIRLTPENSIFPKEIDYTVLYDLVFVPSVMEPWPSLDQIHEGRSWFYETFAHMPDRVILRHLNGAAIFGMEVVV